MATKKKKTSGGKKGKVKPNVPRAGVKFGSKYCGGGKKKGHGGCLK